MSTWSDELNLASARGWHGVLMVAPSLLSMVRECIADRTRYAAWVEEAEARLRIVCAIVETDPGPLIKAAAGDLNLLEGFACRLAAGGKAALAALAAELADA